MNEESPSPENEAPQSLRPARKVRKKFKAPTAAPADRRECKVLVGRNLHLAIKMEACRRDMTIQSLLLDGLRRLSSTIAAAIEREMLENKRQRNRTDAA